ncbi:hypothetical protein [Flavivirga sp. 57AJ16]|uniref:hypothetical protein n=1 Tax=Flavivirga sp. 57AJ16 TaxID=3025307 RepID=UPI002366624C|nr:hypothetical protein [Flavivirga sp. 57AJ16]MDD7887015.1 hypothetical protein [Flavivirga sp. 57AJ16]
MELDEKFWEFNNRANIHFNIIHRLGSLLLMYCVTNEKIDDFPNDVNWYNKDDVRSTNKHRMKETSRMMHGYRKNLNELTIIGLAKTIEDLINDLRDYLNVDVSFWNDCEGFIFFEEMKIIRNLNNCIKHSKGIIKRGHPANDYLIDIAGFNENSAVESLSLDIEKYIYNSFSFQMDLFWSTDKRNNPYDVIKNEYKKIRHQLIPEFIEK